MAVLGTILPLVAGTLLTMAYQKPFFPMGVAAGTALAPTSVGIALRLLGEAGVLKEDFGQVGSPLGSPLWIGCSVWLEEVVVAIETCCHMLPYVATWWDFHPPNFT